MFETKHKLIIRDFVVKKLLVTDRVGLCCYVKYLCRFTVRVDDNTLVCGCVKDICLRSCSFPEDAEQACDFIALVLLPG